MLYQLDMYMRAILNQRQHCVVKINNQNKLMNYKIHLLYIYDKGPPTCVQMMGAECVKFVTHTCHTNVLYDFRNRLSNQGRIRNLKLKRAPVLGKGSEQEYYNNFICFITICKMIILLC